ncbi:MAG: hypothetical protein ACI4DU_05425 [Lachnospiraceae bacterium]
MKKCKMIGMTALLLTFAMMSLGSGSDSSSQKEIVSGASSDGATVQENADAAANGSDTTNAVTIEEQVLFEKDGLRVTATEYVTDSIWGDGIKLLIENESDKDIGIGLNALIVNNYMITDLFSTTVAAGMKDYETVNLSSSELEAAGIENVGQIEFYFHTYDADSFSTISNIDCVTIQTSAYENMDITVNDAGQELYNENGIRIVGKYVDENSFWGASVLLYIENNSGKNVYIHCDDMSINGFMVTPMFSCLVYDGKMAIDEIDLLSSELEENNITAVEKIELKFRITDENFSNSVESDAITFSAQ